MPNFISFFSNIVIALNFFPMTHAVNTALYLTNWFSFVGWLWVSLKNPFHAAVISRGIPFLNTLPLAILHVLYQLLHILPLYFFRKRQTLKEALSSQSFLIASVLFLSYLVLFPEHVIVEDYEVGKTQLLVMAAVIAGCTFLLKKIL
jgi:hypothetical protein